MNRIFLTFFAILLSANSITICFAQERTETAVTGELKNHLAGLNLGSLPYLGVFCSTNDAELDSQKLDGIVRQLAAESGIKFVKISGKEPSLGFEISTRGNPNQGFAIYIEASLVEPVIAERKGKKYPAFATTWQNEILLNYPGTSITEEQIGEGLAMLLSAFIKGASHPSLPDE